MCVVGIAGCVREGVRTTKCRSTSALSSMSQKSAIIWHSPSISSGEPMCTLFDASHTWSKLDHTTALHHIGAYVSEFVRNTARCM